MTPGIVRITADQVRAGDHVGRTRQAAEEALEKGRTVQSVEPGPKAVWINFPDVHYPDFHGRDHVYRDRIRPQLHAKLWLAVDTEVYGWLSELTKRGLA